MTYREALIRYLIIALPFVLLLIVACSSPECPSLDIDEFEVNFDLGSKIWEAVYPLLMDPGSLEVQSYHRLLGIFYTQREDGSKYLSQLGVTFTAKNMFGGRATR